MSASARRPQPPVAKAKPLRAASFFAGIGGFDLGLERAGLEVVFQCEVDPYCQRVLRKHWPKVKLHGDICSLSPEEVPEAEVWCGGWPCQDLSHANHERRGLKGSRSALFYRLVELASARRPRWLILENVTGLFSAESGTALEAVVDSLEEVGYLGGWFAIDAEQLGVPQHRERVFFVASHQSTSAIEVILDCCGLRGNPAPRRSSRKKGASDAASGAGGHHPLVVQRRGGFGYTSPSHICPTLRAQTGGHQGGHTDRPILCSEVFDLGRVRASDGLPGRMDGRRGRFLGNAIVPAAAQWIAEKILEHDGKSLEIPEGAGTLFEVK